MPASLSRTVTFHARHRFWLPGLSAEENRARFGWTSEAPGHGHAYRCVVTVRGTPDPVTRTIVDLALLDRLLAEEVLVLHGRHLNLDVPHFAYGAALPSCEAIAEWLFARIASRLPAGVLLERVRIAEDQTLHADCTGPG